MTLEQTIVDTVREPLLLLDANDRVTLASRSFYRQFQVEPDETLGRPLPELGNGQWRIPKLCELLHELRRSRTPFEDFEVAHEFERIGRRVMLLNARVLASDSIEGGDGLVLLAIEDVTERRRIDAARARVAEELARSNHVLSQFASLAAHDLHEPLRKVQAFGERLETRAAAQLDEQSREYLARLLAAAGRMRTLIDGLLAYARVAQVPPGREPVDLAQLVADVVGDLSAQVERTGGTVAVGPLPTVSADARQIRQVFQNLIGNALKFHRDGVAPRVRVLLADDGVAVEDNGIGFECAEADRIFGLFERLQPGSYEGTGIGLALCRRIVEHHGGTLTASGRPGEGARFVMSLPARPGGQEDRYERDTGTHSAGG